MEVSEPFLCIYSVSSKGFPSERCVEQHKFIER